jgi:hypothetical protein
MRLQKHDRHKALRATCATRGWLLVTRPERVAASLVAPPRLRDAVELLRRDHHFRRLDDDGNLVAFLEPEAVT